VGLIKRKNMGLMNLKDMGFIGLLSRMDMGLIDLKNVGLINLKIRYLQT
jgi:hypothetical protein